MRWITVFGVMLGILAWASPVHAQSAERQAEILLVTAYQLPFRNAGTLTLRGPTIWASGTFAEKAGGGVGLGLSVSFPVGERLSVVGSATYAVTRDMSWSITTGGPTSFESSGGATLAAMAGVGYLLPLRVPTTLSMGPALFRIDGPDEASVPPAFRAPYENWAVNVRASFDVDLTRDVRLRAAVEDYWVFPSNGRVDRFEEWATGDYGLWSPESNVTADPYHVPLISLGLTFGL